MAFVILSSIGFFPSTMVLPGDMLWERDLAYLRTQEILGEEEEILFFYSAAITSISEDGQFISNQYVTSYQVDPGDGELYMSYAAYGDIEDIDVVWATSLLEDTVVTISTKEGDEFELWLSEESGGDKKFVAELKRLWKAR
jgi:hypothetical protein